MSIIDDGVRPSVTLFALILSVAVAIFRICKHRIFGGIARAVSFFELACFATFIFSLCLPTFLYNVNSDKYSHLDNTNAHIEMIVREVYAKTEYYASFAGDVRAVNFNNADFSITVFAPFPAEINVNEIISFDALLTCVDKNELDSTRAYYKRNNILFSAEADADGLFLYLGEDNSLLTRLSSANRHAGYMLDFRLNPREAALSKALVLGDRNYLPDVLIRNFSRIGISHILALSGMHLSLIIGIYLFFAKRIIRCRRLIRISVIPLTIFILLFTGLSASLLRASLMLTVSYTGLVMKRRPDSLTVLFFVLFIILAIDPYSVFDVGLILSFSSVFGILLLMPYFSTLKFRLLKRLHGGFVTNYILPFIYDSFTLSFSACAFTFPAMFLFFDVASLIGILSTLIFTPLIVLYIIISLLIFVFYNVPFACRLLSRAANTVYEIIENISSGLSSLDNICVSCHDRLFFIAFLIVLLALITMILKNSLRVHFAALVLAVHITFLIFATTSSVVRSDQIGADSIFGDDGCTFIASGQGECIIVDLSDGGRAPADRAASGVYSFLHTEVDTLVISRYGAKHHFMVKCLNSYLPIKQVLLPKPVSESEKRYAMNIKALADSNYIKFGYFDLGEQTEISGLGITVITSRSSPVSKAAVAVNITCDHRKYLMVEGNYSLSPDNMFLHFARLADVVYLYSDSVDTPVIRSSFGKDTLVFSS